MADFTFSNIWSSVSFLQWSMRSRGRSASTSTLSYFFYDKNSPMMSLLRNVYKQLSDKNLFGKADVNLEAARLFISPNQMSDPSEIDDFIKIYSETLSTANFTK